MDGDTYVTISWHMKMPGDKHQKKVKAKLHIARIKEIHGYRHVYVVHQQDRLLSWQLRPAFPPAWKECGAVRFQMGIVY